MSQTANSNGESNLTEYRISLTDIRGVGSRTVDKLETVGVSSIRELHLCREGRHRRMARRVADNGGAIGKDTWEHLAAVGKAVHYSGSSRVKAKHLTCSLVSDMEQWGSVDISVQTPNTTNEVDSEPKLPEYSTERLQTALDRIHGEYDEGYSNQVSFEADLGRFLSESDTYDADDRQLSMGIIQSVFRYRHKADRVEAQGDFEDYHKAVIVDLGESL